MKQQEKRYVSRINELEEKAEKHQKTESIVKSLKHDIPKIEDNVYLKLSEMENSFRHQQQLSEEAAKVSSASKSFNNFHQKSCFGNISGTAGFNFILAS